MEQEIFTSRTFEEFTGQFRGIFSGLWGSVLYVNCPVRMGKTFNAIDFIVKLVEGKDSNDYGEKRVVIFCTEKNLLVDSAYLEAAKKLDETKELSLLTFKKDTSSRSNRELTLRLTKRCRFFCVEVSLVIIKNLIFTFF